MDDLICLSCRIPKSLVHRLEASAKRLGMNKSEYIRQAIEEFEQRLMQAWMAELSFRLALNAKVAMHSMESSSTDGLL